MAALVENCDLFAPREPAAPLTPLRHAHTYSPSSDSGALALFAKTVGSNRHTVHGNGKLAAFAKNVAARVDGDDKENAKPAAAAAGRARSLIAAFELAPTELADALATGDVPRAAQLLDKGADARAPEVAAALVDADGAASPAWQRLLLDDNAATVALASRLIAATPALRAAAIAPATLVAALAPATMGGARRLLEEAGWMPTLARALCEGGAVYVIDGLFVEPDGSLAADACCPGGAAAREARLARARAILKLTQRGGGAALACEEATWNSASPSMNGKRHGLWAALFRAKACAYVHVPKAGGTSIEATLFGVRKQTQHSSLGEWNDLLDGGVGPLFKFAFVRHPLQRFLSAFAYILSRDKQAEPDGEPIQTVHFASLLIRRRFARCPKAYLRHLASLRAWEDAPVHFRPQHTFFAGYASESGHGCDFIGKLENVKEDFAALLRAHDFGLDPATPLAHERGTPKLPDHAALLIDPELVALVKHIYARDYDLFGYE